MGVEPLPRVGGACQGRQRVGASMRMVVGLGNPGREYVQTRHNIGFDVVDALACRLGFTSSKDDFDRVAKTKFEGLTVEGVVTAPSGSDVKLLLMKPTTFMNASGRAVQQALAYFGMRPRDMVVVLDDLALPCGKIRLRSDGSTGGHNGLRDIERALGTRQYPRLRVGIDPAPPPIAGRDYVLGKFTPAQRPMVDASIERSVEAIRCWIDQGIEQAMSRFNADETKDKA